MTQYYTWRDNGKSQDHVYGDTEYKRAWEKWNTNWDVKTAQIKNKVLIYHDILRIYDACKYIYVCVCVYKQMWKQWKIILHYVKLTD